MTAGGHGRVCLITGTTHGIGTVTAREIAKAGYCVIMANRDVERAARIRDELIRTTKNDDIHVLPLDLASFSSIREAAAEFLHRAPSLDLLINNAGSMSARRRYSSDGIELLFAVNHLGPFLLTNLLLDRLRASAPARVVVVASNAHRRGKIDLDDSNDTSYSGMRAYARSKLGNVMFALALARRLDGSGVTVNCLHPGVVATNILPHTTNPFVRGAMGFAKRFMRSDEEGAQTSLHVALSSELDGVTGKYFDGDRKIRKPSRAARNVALQERLWELSLKLTDSAKQSRPTT